jgi:hypothetical protein
VVFWLASPKASEGRTKRWPYEVFSPDMISITGAAPLEWPDFDAISASQK